MLCICSTAFQAQKTDLLVPTHTSESWHPFICCHWFSCRIFHKKSKVLFYHFFEELILLSIIIEGVLDCLCFFKLHEGRTGRKESDLKEILKNVINRAAVQRLAIQALPILKCCCEGGWRMNGDVRELCRRKKWGNVGRMKHWSTCTINETSRKKKKKLKTVKKTMNFNRNERHFHKTVFSSC